MAKILILDIETAPKVAYVWRYFKEHVGAKQVLEHGHIMSYAAKWLGEKGIIYHENRTSNDKELVGSLIDLLDTADIVVAHNGVRFDVPQIMGAAIVNGIKPPSPFKVIDTVKVAKREFGFASNSLEYLSIVFGISQKDSHKKFPGFELWLECLRNNEEAWKEMRDYNIQDVITLEELYLKMRPFMSQHPNVGVYSDQEVPVCPKCGSVHFQWRGYAYTNVGKYRRFQCNNCGGWGRTRFTEQSVEVRKNLVTNAVN